MLFLCNIKDYKNLKKSNLQARILSFFASHFFLRFFKITRRKKIEMFFFRVTFTRRTFFVDYFVFFLVILTRRIFWGE